MPVSNFDDIRVGSGSYLGLSSTTERMGLGTVPTTVGAESTVIAKYTGTLTAVSLVGGVALAASDTNFITWAIQNKGAGAANVAMLATTPAGTNTTKVTGGAAVVAYTKQPLTLSGTPANLAVVAGDTISIQANVTGTLANTVPATSLLLTIVPT